MKKLFSALGILNGNLSVMVSEDTVGNVGKDPQNNKYISWKTGDNTGNSPLLAGPLSSITTFY